MSHTLDANLLNNFLRLFFCSILMYLLQIVYFAVMDRISYWLDNWTFESIPWCYPIKTGYLFLYWMPEKSWLILYSSLVYKMGQHFSDIYCLSKKSWPNLYSKLQYKLGQDNSWTYGSIRPNTIYWNWWVSLNNYHKKSPNKMMGPYIWRKKNLSSITHKR